MLGGGAPLARAQGPLAAAKRERGGAATGAVGAGPVETLSLPAEPSSEGKEE